MRQGVAFASVESRKATKETYGVVTQQLNEIKYKSRSISRIGKDTCIFGGAKFSNKGS